MEKNNLLKKLLSEKRKDYTYAIAFFVIFSFFVVYVIRPNLLSVFEANTKIEKLKEINSMYDDQIDKIIEVQSIMEENREDFSYLDEAISIKPEVNKVLSDIDISSESSRLAAESIEIEQINLKDSGGGFGKIKTFTINMNLEGNFEDGLALLNRMYSQRRLKLVPDLTFLRPETQGSESSKLDITFQVEGYYL